MVNMAAGEPAVTNRQAYDVAILSPVGSTVLVGTASILAIGANAARRGIVFMNPGAVTLYVCPSNIPAVIGQAWPILPFSPAPFINDGLATYNCGWNVIAASGSNNPLTIQELL